jgi:cytochrome c-type biogenesis protein CcmH
VHGDINALVAGGYTADEIMAAMTDTYGELILMAPRKRGFNLLAWFVPFAAVGIGLLVIATVLRRWRRTGEMSRRAEDAAPGAAAGTTRSVDSRHTEATPDELARLDAVLRDDSR